MNFFGAQNMVSSLKKVLMKKPQIFMSDVFIPDDHVLPKAQSFKGPFSCLNNARLGIAFGVLGSAEFCIEKALEYSLDRHLFGVKLANKQITQGKLADMVIDWNMAMLGCAHHL